MRFAQARDGDTKPQRIRFAWFPTMIYDTNTQRWYRVWLEHYREKSTYVVKPRPTKFGTITFGKWQSQREFLE